MITARLTPCFSSSADRFSRLPEPKWTSSIGSMVKWPFSSCLGSESMASLSPIAAAGAGAVPSKHLFEIRVNSA